MLHRASGFARDSHDRLAGLICDFARHVQDPTFPCMFAGRAMGRDELLFGLSDEDGVVDLMRAAAEAIKAMRNQVVVLFIDSPRTGTLESEKDLASDLLRRLHHADRVPGIPTRPPTPWTRAGSSGSRASTSSSTSAHPPTNAAAVTSAPR
jgi:hypothetical protein